MDTSKMLEKIATLIHEQYNVKPEVYSRSLIFSIDRIDYTIVVDKRVPFRGYTDERRAY